MKVGPYREAAPRVEEGAAPLAPQRLYQAWLWTGLVSSVEALLEATSHLLGRGHSPLYPTWLVASGVHLTLTAILLSYLRKRKT
jgi:hypothetical protein